jgi:aminoglycoside phosphotransferase (APT) family kinase protein
VQSASKETESLAGTDQPDPEIIRFVGQVGLNPPGATVRFERLTGGVSSDIWLVQAAENAFCVKRALSKLRVATDWHAPVERNANEAAWYKVVSAFMPDCAPKILAHDAQAGMFAMEYLPPGRYPNWKAQLRDGAVDLATANEVGSRLACIHSTTAKSKDLASRFASDAIFHAIRLEPYLLATARVHSDLAAVLESLAHSVASTKLALVHGDASPKNILVGPRAPVFLDAECAWWGDPAFDLAFCLNHLLLKGLWVPSAADRLIEAFGVLTQAYLAGVDWEPVATFERRTARLLPGLFLARVDGKSPVEYLTTELEKNQVRKVATALLVDPPDRLSAVARAWAEELKSRSGKAS